MAPDQSSQIWGWGHHDLDGMTCLGLRQSGPGFKTNRTFSWRHDCKTMALSGTADTVIVVVVRVPAPALRRLREHALQGVLLWPSSCSKVTEQRNHWQEMVRQHVDSPPTVSREAVKSFLLKHSRRKRKACRKTSKLGKYVDGYLMLKPYHIGA